MWFFKFRQFLLMWTKKLYLYFDLRRILIASSVIVIAVLAILPFVTEKKVRYLPCHVHPSAHNPHRFNHDNSGISPFREQIIPNIIHFYRTGKDVNSINFIDALCLYSAFRIGDPDKIMIHTDEVIAVSNSFIQSPFGKRLMQVPGFKKILDIQYWPVPKHVFGIEFNSIYRSSHINDVTRLRILRKYGGIFLDKHAFLLKNIKDLLNYEMAVFQSKEGLLSNHLIIAHRDARMLDLWLKSYHRYYPDVQIHHHTPHVKSLFAQKSTFYHNFERGMQEGSISILSSENGLQMKDYKDYYVLYFNSSKLFNFGSENNFEFESDFVINFVENYLKSIN